MNRDIFAWSTVDMPGIPDSTITYELNVDHRAKPIIQKKRKFDVDRIATNYTGEVQYHKWLSNLMLVKKANYKWRICVDFTYINKAWPKDIYLLFVINKLVDSCSSH